MNINLVIELRILGYFPKKNFLKKVGVRHIWGLTHWNTMTLGCDELFEFVTSSSHFVTLFTI